MTQSIQKKMLALALSALAIPSLFAGKAGGGSTATDVQIVGPFPLPVFDIHDGFAPVQAFASCSVPLYSVGCGKAIFTVPAGKRLVIEYFSGEAILPAGQSVKPSLIVKIGGANIQHFAPITAPAPSPNSAGFGGQNTVSWGQQVRLYADPGTTVSGSGFRSDSDEGNNVGVVFVISGYLVDIQ